MADAIFLSLVIPAYNEQENVPTLLASRRRIALAQIGKPFEVIIIDDGSTDDTPQLLAEAMKNYPWLRGRAHGEKWRAIGRVRSGVRSGARRVHRHDRRRSAKRSGRNSAAAAAAGRAERRHDHRLAKRAAGHAFRRWQSRQANRIRNWITQETVERFGQQLENLSRRRDQRH